MNFVTVLSDPPREGSLLRGLMYSQPSITRPLPGGGSDNRGSKCSQKLDYPTPLGGGRIIEVRNIDYPTPLPREGSLLRGLMYSQPSITRPLPGGGSDNRGSKCSQKLDYPTPLGRGWIIEVDGRESFTNTFI